MPDPLRPIPDPIDISDEPLILPGGDDQDVEIDEAPEEVTTTEDLLGLPNDDPADNPRGTTLPF